MGWSVELAPAAERSLRKLPLETARRVARSLARLEADPRPPGAVKLAGEDDLYRIRVGDFRVVYQVRDKVLVVLVLKIGHRRDVYRR
ncbi:MAG TPA: type II toxin-antitoxin system RelE/ParE family toxin [Polyangia bacterium]|nr:type II toxin-antitoxin system RelE/ParE family toxin [Polyangia bacterium]